MTAISAIRAARLMGCVLGIAVAVGLFVASRPAAGGHAVGAEVDFHADLTGELAVSPAGPSFFIHQPSLRPGDPPATGSFELTNQTGNRFAIHLNAIPSDHSLDRVLSVQLGSGGQTLAAGPIGSLGSSTGQPLILDAGQTKTIDVSASLSPETGEEQAAAALVDIAIVFPHDVIGAPQG
jgi:hypothetical protein